MELVLVMQLVRLPLLAQNNWNFKSNYRSGGLVIIIFQIQDIKHDFLFQFFIQHLDTFPVIQQPRQLLLLSVLPSGTKVIPSIR
jgi:hypothetical protein